MFAAYTNRREFLSYISKGVIVANASPLINTIYGARKMKTGYVYDKRYHDHVLMFGHPESPKRLEEIQKLMKESGLSQEVTKID